MNNRPMIYPLLLFIATLTHTIVAMLGNKSLLPIIAAVRKAETAYTHPNRPWKTKNIEQELLIAKDLPPKTTLARYKYSNEDFHTPGDVNRFLKAESFTIQLPEKNSAPFCVATLMRMRYHWETSSENSIITWDNNPYPAIAMSYKNSGCINITSEYKSSAMPTAKKLISLHTREGDPITVDIPLSILQKLALLRKYQHSADIYFSNHYETLRIPMIDTDYCPDIRWLLGMSKPDKNNRSWPLYIREAQQQIRFQLDETGASCETAVAIALGHEKIAPVVKCTMPATDPIFHMGIFNPSIHEPLLIQDVSIDQCKKPTRQQSIFPFSNMHMRQAMEHVKTYSKKNTSIEQSSMPIIERLVYLHTKIANGNAQSDELEICKKSIDKHYADIGPVYNDTEEWSRICHHHPLLNRIDEIFNAFKEELQQYAQ